MATNAVSAIASYGLSFLPGRSKVSDAQMPAPQATASTIPTDVNTATRLTTLNTAQADNLANALDNDDKQIKAKTNNQESPSRHPISQKDLESLVSTVKASLISSKAENFASQDQQNDSPSKGKPINNQSKKSGRLI